MALRGRTGVFELQWPNNCADYSYLAHWTEKEDYCWFNTAHDRY